MRGMLLKLDPYSSYIDKQELRSFNEHVEQEFGGIGIQVTIEPRTRQLMVMTPLPGTPAYKAGVLAGDRILEIDDKLTADFQEGREMDSAIALMRGKPGALVKSSCNTRDPKVPRRSKLRVPPSRRRRFKATTTTPKENGRICRRAGKDRVHPAYQLRRNSAEEVHDAL